MQRKELAQLVSRWKEAFPNNAEEEAVVDHLAHILPVSVDMWELAKQDNRAVMVFLEGDNLWSVRSPYTLSYRDTQAELYCEVRPLKDALLRVSVIGYSDLQKRTWELSWPRNKDQSFLQITGSLIFQKGSKPTPDTQDLLGQAIAERMGIEIADLQSR